MVKLVRENGEYLPAQRDGWPSISEMSGQVMLVVPKILFNYRIFINPENIVGHLDVAHKNNIHPAPFLGRLEPTLQLVYILDGDWDRDLPSMDVRSTDFFVSCKMRFLDGAAWNTTPVYQYYEKCIRDGRPNGDAPNLAALAKRYGELDRIFESVIKSGSLSPEQKHLIRVSISRSGKLYWGPNGRHRVAMALLAGLRNIPARAYFVHKESVPRFQLLTRVPCWCFTLIHELAYCLDWV